MNQQHDKKTLDILKFIDEGKSREEIAKHYGNKTWNSIDMHMRRRGFNWEDGRYVEESAKQMVSAVEESISINTKAAQIVRMLDIKNPNPRQVAQKQGFENVDQMGKYMQSQGYVWLDEKMNYMYDETHTSPTTSISTVSSSEIGNEFTNDHLTLLNALVDHQDELLLWLQYSKDGQVPHYKFKGTAAQKTLTMTSSSITLLNDFSKEFNVSQRIIVEAALAEYLKKYGYAPQVQQVTT